MMMIVGVLTCLLVGITDEDPQISMEIGTLVRFLCKLLRDFYSMNIQDPGIKLKPLI